MTKIMLRTFVLLAATSFTNAASPQPDREPTTTMPKPNRAQWMAESPTFGIMVHYLVSPPGETHEEKTAALNRIVDAFDLDAFMAQFDATGSEWLIFTIGQNTSYYCSPNAWLDSRQPGHTSRRDLVLEIAREIEKRDKRLIVYLPVEVTGPAPLHGVFAWNPADQTEYLSHYLEFVRTWSRQYGALHDGWWFDGWYPPVTQGKWNPVPWLEAGRAGNPEAAVAIADAAYCNGSLPPVSPLQDYHAGEVHLLEDARIRLDFLYGPEVFLDENSHLRKPGQEPRFYLPDSQFIDGVQWHALVPVDSTFNPAVPDDYCDYSDEELLRFLRACRSVKGAVTFNLPIELSGRIAEESVAKMARLSKNILAD